MGQPRITLDALAGNPYPLLAELRAEAPVTWAPSLGRWLVSRRDLVVEVLSDVGHYTTDDERSPIRSTFGTQMLSVDGTEHRLQRAPFTATFRPDTLRSTCAASIRIRAVELAATLAPGDDLTSAASAMAIGTVLDVLELSHLDHGMVARWYDDLAAALANVERVREVAASGRRAAADLRRALGDADADAEHANNTVLVLFGGIETTQSAILNAVWALAAHPHAQDDARRDEHALAGAVEESLRWEAAVCTLTRFTTGPVELGGVTIPRGSIVECLITAANRDPDAFEDPDRFEPERTNASQHLTFGYGRHHCLGAHLARMEIAAFVGALFEAMPHGFTFADTQPRPPAGHEFRRPPELRIRPR